MNEYKVDFHIHTTYSDGQAEPTAIVKKAGELGYDMIAITDHDGMDGVREALIAGEAVDLTVIPGIELATETEEGTGLHILGYHLDPEHPRLRETLDMLRRKRKERNEKLLAVLQQMGYEITMEELKKQQPHDFIGKPVIARALVAKGYISHPREAFQEGQFLGSPQARAVRKEKLKTAEAIAIIKDAGGIAVLAHPIQTRGIGKAGTPEFYENMEAIVKRLKKQGLGGLECYHPDQDHEQSMRFLAMAEKYHLHITRGSDFHGVDFAEAEPTA